MRSCEKLYITICDDEICTCLYMRDMILKYYSLIDIECVIEMFYSGEELNKYIYDGNRVDILFLDIELGSLTGIDVGKFIRDTKNGEDMKIIYISSKESYAMQLFKIRPFDFLIKPINYNDVEAILKDIMCKLDDQNYFFEYYVGKGVFRLRYNEILYLYSQGKKINVIKVDNTIVEFYGKLKDAIKQLDESFLSIHKSYLVRVDAIVEYKYDTIKIVSGEVLPISQVKRPLVRAKIMSKKRGDK